MEGNEDLERGMSEEPPAEEAPIASDEPVAEVHSPHQGPARERAHHTRVAKQTEDTQTRSAGREERALRGEDVHRPSAAAGQGRRHRRARGVLVGYRPYSLCRIPPRDPRDHAATKSAVPVPKQPILPLWRAHEA